MKQIYDFARREPPVLTEADLRRKLEKRRTRRQIAMLAVAAVLAQLAALVLAWVAAPVWPIAAVMCVGYVLLSVAIGGVIALVCTRKGGRSHG